MNNTIETDKWNVFFKQPADKPIDESYVELIFRLRSDQIGVRGISKENFAELQEDIKDLGKWRKFKELKNDLEK